MIELLLILGGVTWAWGALAIFCMGYIWTGEGVLPERDFTGKHGIYRGTVLNYLWFILSVPLWPIALVVKVVVGLILGW